MAIVKALQEIEPIKINTSNKMPRTILIHRQQDNLGLSQKHEKPKLPHRSNQKKRPLNWRKKTGT